MAHYLWLLLLHLLLYHWLAGIFPAKNDLPATPPPLDFFISGVENLFFSLSPSLILTLQTKKLAITKTLLESMWRKLVKKSKVRAHLLPAMNRWFKQNFHTAWSRPARVGRQPAVHDHRLRWDPVFFIWHLDLMILMRANPLPYSGHWKGWA